MDEHRWINASREWNSNMSSFPLPTSAKVAGESSASSSSDIRAASSGATAPSGQNSWLDPPNVNRYKTDLEQAHAMRRRLRNNQEADLEENVRLGLEALDQADQLSASENWEAAFQIYSMAIELLLRCIKALSQSTNNHNHNNIDSDFIAARLQVALSHAERVKTKMNESNHKSLQNQRQPSSTTSNQTSMTWQSLVSSLSNALAVTATNLSSRSSIQHNHSTTIDLTSSQPHPVSTHNTRRRENAGQNGSSLSRLSISARSIPSQPKSQPLSPQHGKAATSSRIDSYFLDQDPLVQMVKRDLHVPPSELSQTTWADIAGLEVAKRSLQEAAILPLVRPDLFTGLRRPQNILLYGPPGTGKTMLVRAVAYESQCLLFACSASTLTSKWLGEGEKIVKTLFQLATLAAPSLIFLDEMDSLLSNRKSDGNEHEASRRFKTEFMIQMDGIKTHKSGNATSSTPLVLVVGCTNCPWDVDAAVLRRFPRRIYIPLPDAPARRALLIQLLEKAGSPHSLKETVDIPWLVQKTNGFSGSDLSALASEASFGPLRALPIEAIRNTPLQKIRPISRQDFEQALTHANRSVPVQLLDRYQEWERKQQATV